MPLRLRPARPAPSPVAAAAGLVANLLGPVPLAVGRTAAGATMIIRPRTLTGLLGVDSATGARTAPVTQMLGARDVALGLGTLAALRGSDARAGRTWVAAGVLCDAADALVVGAALVRGRVPAAAGAALVAVALAAVAGGVQTLGDDGR